MPSILQLRSTWDCSWGIFFIIKNIIQQGQVKYEVKFFHCFNFFPQVAFQNLTVKGVLEREILFINMLKKSLPNTITKMSDLFHVLSYTPYRFYSSHIMAKGKEKNEKNMDVAMFF